MKKTPLLICLYRGNGDGSASQGHDLPIEGQQLSTTPEVRGELTCLCGTGTKGSL